jgi:hypothetical protein
MAQNVPRKPLVAMEGRLAKSNIAVNGWHILTSFCIYSCYALKDGAPVI